MRIQAEVEIVNRDFNTKTKPVRSSLAIGLKPQLTQVRTITLIDEHKQIFEFSFYFLASFKSSMSVFPHINALILYSSKALGFLSEIPAKQHLCDLKNTYNSHILA